MNFVIMKNCGLIICGEITPPPNEFIHYMLIKEL